MQRNNLNVTDKWRSIPFYEAAVIVPFKESKTVRSPALFKQFLNGQKLMFQYKNQLASPDEIFDIQKMAAYFAVQPTLALGRIKKLLLESSSNTLSEQLELERQAMQDLGQSEDYREGVHAFLEKRPPVFKGQ